MHHINATTQIRKTFEVGSTYSTRSICDHDTIFRWEVVRRTAKTVTIRSVYANGSYGDEVRRGIVRNYSDPNLETVYPNGKYSMCPVIDATDVHVDA